MCDLQKLCIDSTAKLADLTSTVTEIQQDAHQAQEDMLSLHEEQDAKIEAETSSLAD